MPDDDDRLSEAAAAAGAAGSPLAPRWSDVVVPDDISSLEADIRAYRRELRAARRERRWGWLAGRGWQQYGVPGTVVVVALLLATGIALSMTVLTPRTASQRPRQEPVALDAARPVGAVGGLLPDVTVGSTGVDMRLRDVRPAVVAIVPARCDCLGVLESIAGQANEYHLPLIVVGSRGTDVQARALASAIRRGKTNTVYDEHGVLARTYAASGVTLLLVARDAVVTDVERDVTKTQRLEAQLTAMLSPSMRSDGPGARPNRH
jgi:hypothetical protein